MSGKQCGCKGIRTCLLCEKNIGKDDNSLKTKQINYEYCPHCCLFWSDEKIQFPLYLGEIYVLHEFLTEEEEANLISSIDAIQWQPSQSGRRKQDFGPKVNFKKKKVKLGEFKGFPKFAESIVHRFKKLSVLSDFEPVELCNLEYCPERGSAIDPHIDDFWLWGERLVTVNLGSSTVLTLTPSSSGTCKCDEDSHKHLKMLNSLRDKHKSGGRVCSTLTDIPSLELPSDNENMFTKNDLSIAPNTCQSNPLTTITINSLLSGGDSQSTDENKLYVLEEREVIPNSIDNRNKLLCEANHLCKSHILSSDDDISEILKEYEANHATLSSIEKLEITDDTASRNCNKTKNNRTRTMCGRFRRKVSDCSVSARIVLPPRSLLVLAGCARYNWFHEIKRQDVSLRRLAMTFRELTEEFLDGGEQNKLGSELVTIANNFCDF